MLAADPVGVRPVAEIARPRAVGVVEQHGIDAVPEREAHAGRDEDILPAVGVQVAGATDGDAKVVCGRLAVVMMAKALRLAEAGEQAHGGGEEGRWDGWEIGK